MNRLLLTSLFILQAGAHVLAKESGKTTTKKTSAAAQAACAVALLPAQPLPKVAFTHIWKGDQTPKADNVKWINGAIIYETAVFAAKNKRLPEYAELVERMGMYVTDEEMDAKGAKTALDGLLKKPGTFFKLEGALPNLQTALRIGMRELGDRFAPLRTKAESEAVKFFEHHLRAPTIEELALEVNVTADVAVALVDDADAFWVSAAKNNQTRVHKVRERIVTAFLRAAKQSDVPGYRRVLRTTPTLEELHHALVRGDKTHTLAADYAAGLLPLNELSALVGITEHEKTTPQRVAYPVLFKGLGGLEEEVRAQTPQFFNNFHSDVIFGPERKDAILKAVTESPGFIAVCATRGIPLEESQYQLMLHIAERRNIPIIVWPANQELDGLDPRLLNNPRVHILTNTIENPYIRLYALPIMAKNKNPFASLDQTRQFLPGQLTIVGHGQTRHLLIPTGSNQWRDTPYWGAGTMNQPIFPFQNAASGRISGLAAKYVNNGFLMVEKADTQSGLMGEGAQNFWHVRNVYYVNDTAVGGKASVTDLGVRYYVEDGKVKEERFAPELLMLSDTHERIADPEMMAVYGEMAKMFPEIPYISIEDLVDGYSFNPWQGKDAATLHRKAKTGELNIGTELDGSVQLINALHFHFPKAKVAVKEANHPRWLKYLTTGMRMPDHQTVINGSVLAELVWANRVLGISDPFEYWFIHRPSVIDRMPPEIRKHAEENSVFISNPQQVQVLEKNQGFVIGPQHRQVHANFHGDRGSNGRRSSPLQHANANQYTIVGDSHVSGIIGASMVIGTSTPKVQDYTAGYSSHNQSFALVYPDGTSQLITFQRGARSYRQNPNLGAMKSGDFFGKYPLALKPTDNELLPGVDVTDQFSSFYSLLKRVFTLEP